MCVFNRESTAVFFNKLNSRFFIKFSSPFEWSNRVDNGHKHHNLMTSCLTFGNFLFIFNRESPNAFLIRYSKFPILY